MLCSRHLRRFVRAEPPSVVLRFAAEAVLLLLLLLLVADRRCAVTSVILLRRARGREKRLWFPSKGRL